MPQAHSAGASRFIGERRTIYPNFMVFSARTVVVAALFAARHTGTLAVFVLKILFWFLDTHTLAQVACESQSIVPVWSLWRIDLFSDGYFSRIQRFVLLTTVLPGKHSQSIKCTKQSLQTPMRAINKYVDYYGLCLDRRCVS